MGRSVVGAESFTGAPGEDWTLYPGNLKDQGDWAFAVGINRFTYHTFAHKPDAGRPGMEMGPYGVHWDRGQTWWPMAAAYHRYITRCQDNSAPGTHGERRPLPHAGRGAQCLPASGLCLGRNPQTSRSAGL